MKISNNYLFASFIFILVIIFLTSVVSSNLIDTNMYNSNNLGHNDTQYCTLPGSDNLKIADITYSQIWENNNGHTFKVIIKELPDKNYITVEKNGEIIGNYTDERNITYNPEVNDTFKIEQHSNTESLVHDNITIG